MDLIQLNKDVTYDLIKDKHKLELEIKKKNKHPIYGEEDIRLYNFDENMIKTVEKKVKDIIFTNFLYYSIIHEYNSMNTIRDICRKLLFEQTYQELSDEMWEIIWDDVIISLDLDDEEYLFL